jgi:Tol biopolymer transport system component/DNA-binding winged helix-turn-helix (wHTH) protein
VTEQAGRVYRFSEVEVREGEFRLLREGQSIPVEPKAFRVLLYLLEHPKRLVTKEELLDAVWPDTEVSENSLTRSIALLRRALNDDTREPRFIATVPTVGYRFVAPLEEVDASAPQPLDLSAHAPLPAPVTRTLWKLWAATCGAILMIILLAGTLLWHWHGATMSDLPATRDGHSSELLSVRGWLSDPMLSPDAKEIAFLWNGENPASDLYVQLIRDNRGDQRPLRLTHTADGALCCQSWSPDGSEIAYAHCGDKGGEIYVVPALGGTPRLVTELNYCVAGAAGWPLWTSDGQSMIFMDKCAPGTSPTPMRLSLATGEKHCIGQALTGVAGDTAARLSPDGRTVAFVRGFTAGIADIYTLTLATGELRRVTDEGKAIWNLMWAPDSREIIFRSSRAGLADIWRVAARGGSIERETAYAGVGSLSKDGRRLVYLANPAISYFPNPSSTSIVRVDLSAAGGQVRSAKDVISLGAFSDGPQLSPDESQIVFGSDSAISAGWGGEIWKSRADGSDVTQLTALHGHSGTARWSPDGRSIAFDTRPGARSQIYVMAADGRNQRRLIGDGAENVTPSWSRDGRFLYYVSNRTGEFQIWKHELSSGHETELTHRGGLGPLESYDGKVVYYSLLAGGGVWDVPSDGGEEKRVLDPPHIGYWGYFAVTEGGLYLMDFKPQAMIFYYDINRRRLVPMCSMTASPIAQEPGMAASRDGRILLLAQGNSSSSVTMVEYGK